MCVPSLPPWTDTSTLPRIPHLDPADMPEGRRNAGETTDSLFHPSRPSGLGYLIWSKALTCQPKLVHGSGQTPFHLGNPGFNQFGDLERCVLRPGNVHSAEGWPDVLEPVIARYRERGLDLYFRGDAAFAKPSCKSC